MMNGRGPNGINPFDWVENWRVELTLGLPVNRQNSLKLYANTGVAVRTGTNFDTVGVVWQYRW